MNPITLTVTPVPLPGTPPQLILSGPGIAALLAFLLSLAITYIPHFAAWWEAFKYKRTVWAIAGLVIALTIAGLDYAGAINANIPHPFIWPGLSAVITAWLTFAGSAQLTYTIHRQAPTTTVTYQHPPGKNGANAPF